MTDTPPIAPPGSIIVPPPNTPAPDELTITVGAKEIYDKLVHVESKLDALPTIDHEQRIRSLEKWRYATAGGIALGAAAIGWLLEISPHLHR